MTDPKEKAEKEKAPAKKAPVKKELKAEKEKVPAKKAPAKKAPKFEAKEVLFLEGKECIFVERVKDKVLVRFIDGGYASAEESKFSVK